MLSRNLNTHKVTLWSIYFSPLVLESPYTELRGKCLGCKCLKLSDINSKSPNETSARNYKRFQVQFNTKQDHLKSIY